MSKFNAEIARAGEVRTLDVQEATQQAKLQRQFLLIVAAFLLGIVFAFGAFVGYREIVFERGKARGPRNRGSRATR